MESKAAKIHSFDGLVSPPFTALKDNGELDLSVYDQYVDYLVKMNVKGVFVNGTTGEGLLLTVEERKRVAEQWMKAGKHKLELIIIHIGANSIKDAQELAKHAQDIDATGIACLPPLFYKHRTNDDIISYLESVALAAPKLPFMLYHFPTNSGVDIKLHEFLPAAKRRIPSLVGAKYTCSDIRDLFQVQNIDGSPFKIMSGFDEIYLPALASGVTAAVGATYNFVAPLTHELVQAYRSGNMVAAIAAQNRVAKIVAVIGKYGQGVSALKAIMNIIGPFKVGPPRLPLNPLSDKELRDFKMELGKLNWGSMGKVL